MTDEASGGAAPKKQKKLARQEQLPGVENRAIKDIEDAALSYAEGRDARMEATKKEVELKQRIIDAMHSAKKTEYKRGDIEVKLTVEKEKVRVRVKKDESED